MALLDPPQICGWRWWSQQLQDVLQLPRRQAVADMAGVHLKYAMHVAAGGRARKDESLAHAKFVYACAMNELTCECSTAEVQLGWGVRDTASLNGEAAIEINLASSF